ncbi:MAG: sigma-70 family RNA polymerase sigma factor, partial [Planctomycetia bacterium]
MVETKPAHRSVAAKSVKSKKVAPPAVETPVAVVEKTVRRGRRKAEKPVVEVSATTLEPTTEAVKPPVEPTALAIAVAAALERSMAMTAPRSLVQANGQPVKAPNARSSQPAVDGGRMVEYVVDPTFADPTAVQEYLGVVPVDSIGGDEIPAAAASGRNWLPALSQYCETPLLTRHEEVFLFRQMNFLKHYAALRRDAGAPIRDVAELLRRADRVRNRLIQTNLRLVVSVAKRYVNDTNRFDELLSEGIVHLIRAIEKFDCSRGFRFSTYATRTLQNNLNHLMAQRRRQQKHFVPGEEWVLDET